MNKGGAMNKYKWVKEKPEFVYYWTKEKGWSLKNDIEEHWVIREDNDVDR